MSDTDKTFEYVHGADGRRRVIRLDDRARNVIQVPDDETVRPIVLLSLDEDDLARLREQLDALGAE